jgi:hypothetical protein
VNPARRKEVDERGSCPECSSSEAAPTNGTSGRRQALSLSPRVPEGLPCSTVFADNLAANLAGNPQIDWTCEKRCGPSTGFVKPGTAPPAALDAARKWTPASTRLMIMRLEGRDDERRDDRSQDHAIGSGDRRGNLVDWPRCVPAGTIEGR